MKKFLYLLAPLTLSATLFADEAAAPARNPMQPVLMIGIAAIFFYMILWRPEQKRRKKLREQQSNLQKGDRITAMGIIGTLEKEEKESIILKMVDGTKVEMLKTAISDVKSAQSATMVEGSAEQVKSV